MLRHRALRDLAAHDDPAVVDAVLEHLPEAHVALLPTMRRVLAAAVAPESTRRLRRAGLGSRDPVVREQVVLALGEGLAMNEGWGPELVELLDDHKPGVRAAAVYSLGRLRHAPALSALLEAAADGDARVRRQVPEALVRLAGTRSVGAVARLLDDPDWRVRAAAARALGDARTRAAAQALIDRLDTEQGRVAEDILASLSRLTGVSFGLNLAAWRRWLEQADGELVPPLPGRPSDASPGSGGGPTRSVARYYGVPTLSHRFVIITDLSTSMGNVDAGGYGGPNTAGRTRLELTKQELDGLLRELDEDVHFNLVTFSTETQVWEDELVPADARQRERARAAVAGWTASGGTNLFSALEHVLDLAAAEARGERRAERRAPDTVYVLTDGQPFGGQIEDMPLLLEYVRERNRELDVRFHTIALTSDRDHRDFLTTLAKLNGGTSIYPLE